MLIMASLEKMKGQVFQKHPCVCPEHEKYSPGENGFSVSTSKCLGAPNTWGTVARSCHTWKRKKESKQHLFRKYANPRMQKRTEGNSGEIGNWPTYPLGLARSFMRSWWESLEILSGGPKIALKQPPESKRLKIFLHLSLFLRKICEDERKS